MQAKTSILSAIPILLAMALLAATPQQASAIPAFARKYNVKCYVCHTIPPVLNKNGYLFKRLGYRMPPDEMDGTKPAKVVDLDKEIKFNITNSIALVTIGSLTADKATGSNTTSSFNLDEAALFAAGAVEQTNFSYFVQYELYQGGSNGLEQAYATYTGGKVNSSYFVKAGEMHLQEGEGTRGAFFYSLFPEPSPLLTYVDPINFSLDQHPAGVNVGYTWTSPYYKKVFAISGKVTNGLAADGSEILLASTKNAKDVWVDADYWFGPDGGITFMAYRGSKDQDQNPGTPDEFIYRPTVQRYGVFGNYLFFDKLDVTGGYLRSKDDWQAMPTSPVSSYVSNGFRGEVDYYAQTGFALMARYDQLNQKVAAGPVTRTEVWSVGADKAITERGNVIVRAAYSQERDTDPVLRTSATDKLFKVDFRFAW